MIFEPNIDNRIHSDMETVVARITKVTQITDSRMCEVSGTNLVQAEL